ncbi:MAG: aminotransferase class I/II-fold pyridoxal phosphate-dependent enzyme [Balneolaceae bacterium]|nr:aminotransferase class I/II-fold pyridoxal phosphate-dependent enzyme [Balneolaceae bacterium]MBO6546849.1 aminotransferase class I/II-fold pyridoxal phosphate-dependent enzyme [Balneolaceae bacterium]MBO6649209.1 aminotransferase class I/II-fold pyridoxal phosphate-dependent enzyme [Balneolaceae bacterium]
MKNKEFETKAIRHQIERTQQREHSVPIFATSSYMFEDAEHARALFAKEAEGNVYSRYSNPNNDEFVDKLCLLEGAEAGISTASGMAAMFVSIASFLNQGDHIVACRSVFGSTHQILTQLLPRWGITHNYVDIHDIDGWERAITPKTKMFFFETPSNPALDLIDIEKIAQIAKAHNILVNVDNCFATPYLQNPIEWGADIVTHSATKFIDGQGRMLGGAILGRKELIEEVMFMSRHTGPAMSPFNGWVLSKSLETLAVRMDRHCSNAFELATFLSEHNRVDMVKYPYLESHPQNELAKKQMRQGGGIVTFEVKGGLERGRTFLDALKMLSLSANLGDTRSIATHPASTTHSKLSEEERETVGISPGLVRISTGLENIKDIVEDIDQALMKDSN